MRVLCEAVLQGEAHWVENESNKGEESQTG